MTRFFLFSPYRYLFAALNAQQPKAAERAMRETEVVLGGLKHFRAPAGLGAVSSQKCYVLLVKRGFDLGDLFGQPATEQSEGLPVWRWSPKLVEFGEKRCGTPQHVGRSPAALRPRLKRSRPDLRQRTARSASLFTCDRTQLA